MASRLSPRRSFATPFVLTLATVPACMVSSTPPTTQAQPAPYVAPQNPNTPPPTTPPPHSAPTATPPPTTPTTTTVMTNPPRPTTPVQTDPTKPAGPTPLEATPPKSTPTAPTTDRHWVVARTGTSCRASDTDACRGKPAPRNGTVPTCTTPMVDYKCPDGLADGATLNIIQAAGKLTCNVVMPAVVCPAKPATCNPPPPRQIACP